MKKLVFLIGLIVVAFIFFFVFYLVPKEYEVTYKIGDYTIIEKYFRNEKYYYFEISLDEFEYTLLGEFGYQRRRRLITEIEEFKEDDINCILPKIRGEITYPLCYKGDERVSFSLIRNTKLDRLYKVNNEEINNSFKDINISAYLDKAYLLRHYRGFYYISRDEKREINLFNRDIYDMPLVGMVNNFLFIPDYNNLHSFKSAYIINMKTGRYEKWNLDYEIYFTAYFMGAVQNSIYIFDAKTRNQYEIVPHRKRMRIVNERGRSPRIYRNGWETVSIDTLVAREQKFSFPSLYNYEVKNGKLMLSFSVDDVGMRVSDLIDIKIIHQDRDTIYYLKDDKLYAFNPFKGEVLLMQYFEWNFNKNNMVFIY